MVLSFFWLIFIYFVLALIYYFFKFETSFDLISSFEYFISIFNYFLIDLYLNFMLFFIYYISFIFFVIFIYDSSEDYPAILDIVDVYSGLFEILQNDLITNYEFYELLRLIHDVHFGNDLLYAQEKNILNFFKLFQAEIFCFTWILILIFFGSFYTKIFYNSPFYNLQKFVKNIFLLILGVLLGTCFFYFKLIYYYINYNITLNFLIFFYFFPKKYFNDILNLNTWSSLLQLDLLFVKLLVLILFLILIFFYLKINFETNIKIKYTTVFFEYPIFFLLTFFMCNILLSANHLMLVFLSIVGLSLCLYALISFDKNTYSIEAAIKYLSIGSIASGLILFGIFTFYYNSQTLFLTDLQLVWSFINTSTNFIDYFFYSGIISFILGFFFKLSIFPCHAWAPDVYDGSSIIITSILIIIIKTTIFFYLIFFIISALKNLIFIWTFFFLFSGICSVFIGTFGALFQNRLKRFLAFTSMNQLGLSLISLSFFSYNNYIAISLSILNFIIYIFASLTFFITLFYIFQNLNLNFEKEIQKTSSFTLLNINFSLNDLNSFNPYFSLLVTLSIMSMAGIPPFIGFFSKYLILTSLFSYSSILAFVLLILHIINTFNYLRLIQIIWFKKINYFFYFKKIFIESYFHNYNFSLDTLTWLNFYIIFYIEILINFSFLLIL